MSAGATPEPLAAPSTLPSAMTPDKVGNKAANLARLEGLLQRFEDAGRVGVPPFIAISHQHVRAHLLRYTGSRLCMLEARFNATMPKHAKELSDEAREALLELRTLVKDTLKDSPLPLNFPLFGNVGCALMVRSAGCEDGDKVTNPGGNTTRSNVPNNSKDGAAAIAEMVSAYYSERSVKQRLLEGGTVSAPFFTPVLLQVMVGEKPGGPIPRSGVLFTKEPEGPTPITQIQATLGHNEAVVASLLPCDTYLVGASGVRAQHKHKVQRLVPNTINTDPPLVYMDNPAALRMAPALSDAVVQRLHALGQYLMAHEGGVPQDIEFTYCPADDTIYVVQMRPLIFHARDKPTHLDAAAVQMAPKLSGTMVGAAGGKTRVVTTPRAVIMAPDLPQALQVCLRARFPKKIQAAVVEGHAEPTSHEATMFRAAQKPVMVLENLQDLQDFMTAHLPVALDASMGEWVGLAGLVKGRSPSLATLKAEGLLRDGWGKHPLPASQTTPRRTMAAPDLLQLVADIVQDVEPCGSSPHPDAQPLDVPAMIARLQQVTADVFTKGGPRKSVIERLLGELHAAPDQQTRARAMAGLLRFAYTFWTVRSSSGWSLSVRVAA